VRREYSIYPDLLYKPGRKKVLQHFLNMEHIFKTIHFYTLYEQNARNNLNREIAEL
jgi:predicted metal-dependent HD superfamily phosphohydrolase